MARMIGADEPDVVDQVAQVLESGGVVVLPTDTVYGLAALPSHEGAIARVFEIKRRPEGMHLAVLVADAQQASAIGAASPGAQGLMEALWPGALTVVLPAAAALASVLGAADGTIGVRCPDHDLVRDVARRVGPIAATSANLHGHPTPATAAEVAAVLPDVDLVVDGGRCGGGVASTVVDATADAPHVLRPGPIDEASIRTLWGT